MATRKTSRRGPRSSIELLDADLVKKVNQLIRDGHTIAEITNKLNELGADVSHSAVGRYTKSAKENMQRFEEAQKFAAIWTKEIGENPDGDIGRLVGDLLQMVAYQTVTQMGDSEKPIKAAEIMNLAIAMEKIMRTKQIDLKLYVERKQIKAQAEAAAKEISTQVKKAGMSDETAKEISHRILGIGSS